MTTVAGGALLVFFLLAAIALVLSALVSDVVAAILIGWQGAVCSILLMLAGAARLTGAQDFHQPLWILHGVGQISLHIDALSAVFLFAAVLAHSSIENAGIIVAGIGAFFAFRSSVIAVPAAIALTAATILFLYRLT